MRKKTVSTKAHLLLRIVRPDGSWTYAKPVFAGNNRLKPLYALVNGKPEHHPEGAYYVRFSAHGRRHLKRAGSDSTEALRVLARQMYLLHGLAMGVESPELPPQPAEVVPEVPRQRWDNAVHIYMLEVEARRAKRTATAYRHTLESFEVACPVTYLDEISRATVLAYESSIVRKGNDARTVFNRVAQLVTFLRYWQLSNIVERKDLPHYTKKKAKAYQLSDLRTLNAAANETDRLLFEFFLGSGCREQEVMYMTAQDIDFEDRLVHVHAKPEWGWKPKDKEERSIPVSDDLLHKLRALIESRPQQRLLFPLSTDPKKPDGHLLRRLKSTALRAGLNCGHCTSKDGDRCSTKPVCKRWSQHGYRRTFATVHHRNGVSVRTLMDWLGHSDLATVLSYLASEDTQSAATRQAANSSFAGVSLSTAHG